MLTLTAMRDYEEEKSNLAQNKQEGFSRGDKR